MTSETVPFLSVIIPTYARPTQLARCVEALSCQDYPKDRFAIVVVDDGSPTPAAEVLGQTDGLPHVEVIRQKQSGPAVARNAGAERARGSLLVFTDDDCVPHAGWLRAFSSAHVENPKAAFGGNAINALRENRFSVASQLLIDYLYTYFNADPSAARFYTSNNFAVPAEIFREIGGFPANFPLAAGEDRELCDRLVALGHTLRHVPDARIDHHHGLTLRRFLRQHFGYGRGGFQFQRARAQRGMESQIEPLRFYVDLLLYPFKKLGPAAGLATTALFICAQTANAAGFFWELGASWLRARAS